MYLLNQGSESNIKKKLKYLRDGNAAESAVPTFDQFLPNPLNDSYPTNYVCLF